MIFIEDKQEIKRMRPDQIENAIAWQRISREFSAFANLYRERAYRFNDKTLFEMASTFQERSARASRWAREEMGIEPKTWLD